MLPTPVLPPAPDVTASLAAALPWMRDALLIGIASARFAFAFLLVPIFSPTVMPATVRNSVIIAFGLVALAVPRDFAIADWGPGLWLWVIAKEAIAGTVIGFLFASVLWAVAAAGEIIDTKVGATIGQLLDPLSQTQQSLTALALGRFAQTVFVTAGGLTLLVGTIMHSYAIWPLGPAAIRFDGDAHIWFRGEFGRLFQIGFFVAAPVLAVLYLIDAGMGLLNRFAQQFNVFQLSMPIKAVAAVLVLVMILPILTQAIVADTAERPGMATETLRRVGQPEDAPVAIDREAVR